MFQTQNTITLRKDCDVRHFCTVSKRLVFLLALGFVLSGNAPAQTQAVRLALIAETADATAASDVLTARLSTNSQIQLLERNEIEKVYREQGLSAMNGDYLKLGRILGADGLLILHLSKGGDSQRLMARLVAVKPGVTLSQPEYPWPLDNPLQWAGVVATQFQPLFPKLAVLAKDALPISILNLRSAVASVQGETLERELTELLYARLINEKDVFVLERRRMELLSVENQWSESEEKSFWNGSYLLEGVIDKAGLQKDVLTIEAMLTPPDKKDVLSVQASGARTNLPAVVNDLASRILAALKKQSSPVEWNPRAEADRYFEEAQWMLKWRMYQEAKSAGEAAWALGKQNDEVAKLKIKAYQGCAGDPGMCIVTFEEGRVVFGQLINRHVIDASEAATCASAPEAEQFTDLVRAGEIFQDTFRPIAASVQEPDPAWLKLGASILDQTSLWLRYYYFTVEARHAREAAIDEARQLCLTITGLLESQPGFAKADTNATLLTVKARNVAFWVDTPEQCLPVYRAMLESGQWPLVRRRFINAAYKEVSRQVDFQGGFSRTDAIDGSVRFDDPHGPPADLANPCLVGWTWADRKRCPAVWNGFIDELCNSSKPLTSLEGKILRCSYAWSEEDFERHFENLLNEALQQHEAIIAAGLGTRLLDDLNRLIQERVPALIRERQSRVQNQAWKPFKEKFTLWVNQNHEAMAALQEVQKRRPELEKKKDYLNSQTNFDFMSFARIVLNDNYKPAEARELLPLVSNYFARILTNQPADRVKQQQVKYWVNNLENKLAAIISPPPPRTNLPGPPAVRAAVPAPHIPSSGTNPAPKAVIRSLDMGHFWNIPTPAEVQTVDSGDDATYRYTYFGQDYTPQIASCCFRDGRLWVEVRFDEHGYLGRAQFWGIDLATWAADKIQFQGEEFSLPNLIYQKKSHPFEAHEGYLYLSLGSSVRRYSFKAHSWEQFPVPASDGITPVRLANRLFFTTSSSILEYGADGSFRTLASSRRRPAMTLLDGVEDYGSPHLFLTVDHALHVHIGDDIYMFSTQSNNWLQVATLPKHYEYFPFEDGFLTGARSWGEWQGMFSRMSSPQSLFPTPTYKHFQPAKTGSTYWPYDIPGIEFCLQDSRLWFLVNSPKFQLDGLHKLQAQPVGKADPALICCTFGEKQPVTIPVRFETGDIKLISHLPYLANPWDPQWILQWTPQGMVMIHAALPGFWLIPATDLETALQNARSRQLLKKQEGLQAANASHEQWRKELLAAYDRNHSGVFDPDERKAMIDDPRYLELELPVIDANSNGLLDAAELGFFDANTNGVLDPQEEKAIDTTLGLLAEKLMPQAPLDSNLVRSPACLPPELLSSSNYMAPGFFTIGLDSNDRATVKKNLVDLLRMYLLHDISAHAKFTRQGMQRDPHHLLKQEVEAYWKFKRGQTNLPASSVPPQH
jgi:hypothetical protein